MTATAFLQGKALRAGEGGVSFGDQGKGKDFNFSLDFSRLSHAPKFTKGEEKPENYVQQVSRVLVLIFVHLH